MLPEWIVSPDGDGNYNVRRKPEKGTGAPFPDAVCARAASARYVVDALNAFEGDFLTEMEMRSAHASFVAEGGSKEPWFGWSFQRRNYSPVLFCLRMFYGFTEGKASDLYEGAGD